jgi:hypothetical protein
MAKSKRRHTDKFRTASAISQNRVSKLPKTSIAEEAAQFVQEVNRPSPFFSL